MTNLCLDGDTAISIICNNVLMTISIEEAVDLFNSGKELLVLSRDLSSNQDGFVKIENAAMTNDNSETITILDEESGYTLICTEDHKIYTKNRGFVVARDLLPTDILQYCV
jgi:intein/homing endonuclease